MGTAQASAVPMLAAARLGLPLAMHTPSEVKAAVTGQRPGRQGPGDDHGDPHPQTAGGTHPRRCGRRLGPRHLPCVAGRRRRTASPRPWRDRSAAQAAARPAAGDAGDLQPARHRPRRRVSARSWSSRSAASDCRCSTTPSTAASVRTGDTAALARPPWWCARTPSPSSASPPPASGTCSNWCRPSVGSDRGWRWRCWRSTHRRCCAPPIAGGDLTTLVKVPGIGRKGAERIVLELKDKVGRGVAAARCTRSTPRHSSPRRSQGEHGQVVEALVGLGWSGRQAQDAVASGWSARKSLRRRLPTPPTCRSCCVPRCVSSAGERARKRPRRCRGPGGG